MDFPTSIEGLCSELGIVAWHLQLNCIFCTCHLDIGDLCAFMHNGLKLKWIKSFPYAACHRCTLLQARVLAWRHQTRAAYAVTVEEDCGQPLGNIQIRCVVCTAILRPEDKLRHREHHRRFILAAGYWRGRCGHCWNTAL
ncbi:early protein E6 [Saimiri sciureus papillomavirus 1]|uniref:Protein E6 n=1 Tax=Saimiri sciureus papillomavirus 1 TaxID=990304 RepID=W5QK87_9PAPI|nr:early protein E6 [Saimiri sciureus papillomavirus 1]AEA35055.1 early protein E6 [Saimiri sciureus papillomavirus 1]